MLELYRFRPILSAQPKICNKQQQALSFRLQEHSLVMDGQTQRTGSGELTPAASTLPRRTTQQPLSCAHCRQRKIKCDKTHPCANCKRSGLDCVFPERVRHPKKRRDRSKANGEELLHRLARMEELIEKMKTEGKDVDENKIGSFGPTSPETPDSKGSMSDGTRSSQETGIDVSRFIGSAFWRSLTNEVGINFLGTCQHLTT